MIGRRLIMFGILMAFLLPVGPCFVPLSGNLILYTPASAGQKAINLAPGNSPSDHQGIPAPSHKVKATVKDSGGSKCQPKDIQATPSQSDQGSSNRKASTGPVKQGKDVEGPDMDDG